MHSLYQVVLHRIGRCINQLIDHILAVNKPHDADLLARPKILPSAAQRILTAREYLMEVFHELGVTAPPVEDYGMVVVRHRTWQEYVDLTLLRGLDETVGEGVVGLGIWSQQELALRAPARDQVELTGEHLPRQRHAAGAIKNSANLSGE
jgi:hypothetical protein